MTYKVLTPEKEAKIMASIQADCRRAQTQAIDYHAPGKGVTFVEPTNTEKRRKRITRYELTGIVRGTVAVYC